MTTTPLYRFRCDAPFCDAAAIGEKITGIPPEWRAVSSTDHVTGSRTVGTRRKRTLVAHERCIGDFRLHLCGNHPAVFDGHLPLTEGAPGGQGRQSMVTVSCSCGARFGWTVAAHLTTRHKAGPSGTAERLWWAHLPADLRWYAEREQVGSDA